MPKPNGSPDLAVEAAPVGLARMVNGVNGFLSSLSDALTQAQSAADLGGSQLAMSVAAGRLDGFLVDTVACQQCLAEALDLGAEFLTSPQQDLVNAIGDEVGRISGDDILQSTVNSAPLLGLRAQLSDGLTQVANQLRAGAIDSPAELSREAALDRYAERQAMQAMQAQEAIFGHVLGLADTAISLARDLRSTEVIAINRTVIDKRNIDPRVAGDQIMDGVKAKDVAGPGGQWMHLLARCLGGLDAKGNLAAGHVSQNQRMLKVEIGLRNLVDAKHNVHVEIACSRDTDTRQGDELFYRVEVDGQQLVDIRFDLQKAAPLDTEQRAEIAGTLRDMRDCLANDLSPLDAIRRLAEIIQVDNDVRQEIQAAQRAELMFEYETAKARR